MTVSRRLSPFHLWFAGPGFKLPVAGGWCKQAAVGRKRVLIPVAQLLVVVRHKI
jgi:hypothetical protein